MPYWPEIFIKGSALDLRHLSPFTFECSTPADAKPDFLTVNVRYSNHVFSEEFDAAVHAEDTVIWDHKRKRAFCQERYDLSFELPKLLEGLSSSKVHQTASRRNYLFFRALSKLAGREYQIYFTLKKQKSNRGDVDLYVESAYASDEPAQMRKRPNSIRFSMLALKVYRGQPVKFSAR